MSYAKGEDYSRRTSYYYLININSVEFLEKLRKCVETESDKIEGARVYWEPIFHLLQDAAETIAEEDDGILGLYKPITHKEYVLYTPIMAPPKSTEIHFWFRPFCATAEDIVDYPLESDDDDDEPPRLEPVEEKKYAAGVIG
jgi:hypothetical protein